MPKSVFSKRYKLLRNLLVVERKSAGLTQQQLAARLGKPQSFVSKFELGERRLDAIEFLAVARALGADPYAILRKVERAPRGGTAR